MPLSHRLFWTCFFVSFFFSKFPIMKRQLQLQGWRNTPYLRCEKIFLLQVLSLFTRLYDHFIGALSQIMWVPTAIQRFSCAEGIWHKLQFKMISKQYACSSRHFRMVYRLRPTHFQGMPETVETTRNAAPRVQLSLDVLGMDERIFDGLVIMED